MKRLQKNVAHVVFGTSLALFALGAHAQGSNQPVRILVGFPPGGNVDIVARQLAEGMSREMGRSVLVENRSGAGGQIAARALTEARPDGNTLFLSNEHAMVTIPLTMKNPGYDSPEDFTPIAKVANVPMGLVVNPSIGVSSLEEFGEWAKKQSKVHVGVPARASLPDFAVGLIGKALDVGVESVPYRGGAPMVIDLVGGQIPAGFTGLSEVLPHQEAGTLRIIAVTGEDRLPVLPDVPTFGELGIKELEKSALLGLFAPKGAPAAVIDQYNQVLGKLLSSDVLRKKLTELAIEEDYRDAGTLSRTMEETARTWKPIIDQSGFVPQ